MNRNNNKNNSGRRRRSPRNITKRPVITGRDLDAVRVRGAEKPISLPVNTVVERRTRLSFPVTPAGSVYTITPNLVSLQDATDYGTGANLRFSNIRISRIEAWFTLGTLTGYTGEPILELSDSASGAFFRDAVASGVDYAHVAIRPSLHTRSTWYTSSVLTPNLTTVQVSGITASTGQGSLFVDITFEAN